jgi:diguanylate cyclase (GGDEF)-like protein
VQARRAANATVPASRTAPTAAEQDGERLSLVRTIAQIRWVGVLLGLTQAAVVDAPGGARLACVAVTMLLALANVGALLVPRLRPRSGERVVVLSVLVDHAACTAWVVLLASERSSSVVIVLSLVALEAAILYGWRGTLLFSGGFVLSLGALYATRSIVLHYPVSAGGLEFRTLVVLMLAVLAGAISTQSHRRQRAAAEAAARSAALYAVASRVARTVDRDEALDALGDALATLSPQRWHAIALAGPDGDYDLIQVRGNPSEVSLVLPPVSELKTMPSQVIVDDIHDPRLVERWPPPPELAHYGSGALLPVHTHDHWFGVLISLDPQIAGFSADDVEFLVALAAEAASVLERTELVGRLENLATTDAVTGLRNRREFERVLDETSPQQFAVLAIDVDNLKLINDEFGHEAGDAVLRAVARGLSGLLREWDFVARIGGDEFAALLMGATAEEAFSVAERIRAAMHGIVVQFGQARISAGAAVAVAGTPVREVWQAADAALFRAKRSGRDRVVAAGADDTWREGAEWSVVLPELISQRAVRAVYQPIVGLADRRLVGYEALARPTGLPTRGSVEAMFAAAHHIGVARDLDWLCRRTALQQASHIPPGIPIFVNVGVGALLDPIHDVDQMLLVLRWSGRSAHDVVLEITERETITDLERLRVVLARYRREGFRVALDDVGEGRCTLEVLATALPEFLKLARSLVANVDKPGPRAAVEAAVAFARSSGAAVIAEGIETATDVERMRGLGIELGQGWFLGVPQEAASLVGMPTNTAVHDNAGRAG